MAGDALREDPAAHYYVPGCRSAKPELVEAIARRACAACPRSSRELAGGSEDAGSKAGLASLLKTIWGKD